jgi:hypothetical protein
MVNVISFNSPGALYDSELAASLQVAALGGPHGSPHVILLQEQGLRGKKGARPRMPVFDDWGSPYTLQWQEGVPLLYRSDVAITHHPLSPAHREE